MGKKAEKFAARRGYDLAAAFKMGSVFPSYGAVYPLLDLIAKNYAAGTVSSVDVLFTEFKSKISQTPVTRRLLPVEVPKDAAREEVPYIFEPGAQAILNELLPYYVETELYDFIIQAYTSEQAARMVAMKNAKDNAIEITDFLTNSYNRSRQERITGEILDLANGQIA
jgi:F-type H+-transporting ATPase subunit gamma